MHITLLGSLKGLDARFWIHQCIANCTKYYSTDNLSRDSFPSILVMWTWVSQVIQSGFTAARISTDSVSWNIYHAGVTILPWGSYPPVGGGRIVLKELDFLYIEAQIHGLYDVLYEPSEKWKNWPEAGDTIGWQICTSIYWNDEWVEAFILLVCINKQFCYDTFLILEGPWWSYNFGYFIFFIFFSFQLNQTTTQCLVQHGWFIFLQTPVSLEIWDFFSQTFQRTSVVTSEAFC